MIFIQLSAFGHSSAPARNVPPYHTTLHYDPIFKISFRHLHPMTNPKSAKTGFTTHLFMY